MKDISQVLFEYNPWWDEISKFPEIIEREKVFSMIEPIIHTPDLILLTGLRRVGKTTMMKNIIKHLVNHDKINVEHCLYISMDDYQLSGLSLQDVIISYRKLLKISNSQKLYVFFDEITYMPDFQIQLKNIYDKGNIKCFASSSSSSLLKDDSAYLTGRKRVVEINPLDFDEYLHFCGYQLNRSDNALREAYFEEYMQVGGMPEYVIGRDREYLVSLIDDILMKDIVAHHKIKSSKIIKDFFILLMERAGKQVSINKVANILGISPDTAKRYLTMFEETYLIHLVSRHGKTNESLLSAKKIYATDLGMRNVTVGFRDKGAIFENIVFMKIKDKSPQYVLVDGQEIDFFYDETLLEVKYHRDIVDKQLAAFQNYPAPNKVVVKSEKDLKDLS